MAEWLVLVFLEMTFLVLLRAEQALMLMVTNGFDGIRRSFLSIAGMKLIGLNTYN